MRPNVLLFIIGVLLLSWFLASRLDPTKTPDIAAPEFTWRDFDGGPHTLSQYPGKPVVLHFWASWCGPCRGEFPKLMQAAAAHPEILFVAISSDDDPADAKAFIEKAEAKQPTPANLMYATDPKKEITYTLFQTSVFPETILLDGQHHLHRKFPGVVDWDKEYIQNILRHL